MTPAILLRVQQPLNDFQKLMRKWTSLAPYNAGHLMRVSGAPQIERWSIAIAEVLRAPGFMEEDRFPVELSTLELEEKITAELSTPFPDGAVPLRAFVIADAPDSHLLGVFFDHWFADSASIRDLMRRAFAHYRGAIEELPPLRPAEKQGPVSPPLAGLASCLRAYFRHRRAHRFKLRTPLDFGNGFLSLRFPAGAIDRIRAVAKAQDATVNDVFLAASAQTLGEFTAQRRTAKPTRFLRTQRDRIGIATAVDLRPRGAAKSDNAFGFFLEYFTVVVDQPEKHTLPELARAVAQQTTKGKAQARASHFLWSLRGAHWVWDHLSSKRSQALYSQKTMPILAGISNVDLTGSWADMQAAPPDGRAAVLDYFRVSPVGPLAPLLFTFTTIRDRLSLCVTYRTTALSRAECERLALDLRARLSAP